MKMKTTLVECPFCHRAYRLETHLVRPDRKCWWCIHDIPIGTYHPQRVDASVTIKAEKGNA